MDNIVFKCKYPTRSYLGFIAMIFAIPLLISRILMANEIRIEIILITFFFGVMPLLAPFIYIRQITFENSEFVIQKFMGTPKRISYQAVVDIGNTMVKTRQGNISIKGLKNANDLLNIFKILMSEGKINKHQLENNLLQEESHAKKALILSLVLSFPLSFFIELPFSFGKSIDNEWIFFIFFLPIYLVTYFYLKLRSEQNI